MPFPELKVSFLDKRDTILLYSQELQIASQNLLRWRDTSTPLSIFDADRTFEHVLSGVKQCSFLPCRGRQGQVTRDTYH
jgi:hypothetical protein